MLQEQFFFKSNQCLLFCLVLLSFEDFAKEKWWQQFAAYRMRLDCFIAKKNFSTFSDSQKERTNIVFPLREIPFGLEKNSD